MSTKAVLCVMFALLMACLTLMLVKQVIGLFPIVKLFFLALHWKFLKDEKVHIQEWNKFHLQSKEKPFLSIILISLLWHSNSIHFLCSTEFFSLGKHQIKVLKLCKMDLKSLWLKTLPLQSWIDLLRLTSNCHNHEAQFSKFSLQTILC